MDKGTILEILRPHIDDDQDETSPLGSRVVPSVHMPYVVTNTSPAPRTLSDGSN
jgi:hypothetical protein